MDKRPSSATIEKSKIENEVELGTTQDTNDWQANDHDDNYSPEEKKLVKKISWTLLPLVWCIIFVQFVDKSILSVAAVTGLLEDTHMGKAQYSWASSIIYLGYLVYQVPNNILIQRLPQGKYLGSLIFFWGVVVAATCVVDTFQQVMAMRFLLGLFEAGTNPVLYIILNALYRRKEQSAVFGFLIISSGSGTSLGALIGYGIVQTLDGRGGWRAWRWAYLIFGIVTVFVGIVIFFFLIDTPTAKILRLTPEQEKIVQQRTADNMVVKSKKIKKYQILEALTELRFWCLCLAILFINMQNGGLIAYAVLLVQSLGFDNKEAILLQIPSGAAAVLFTIMAIVLSRKTGQIIYTAIVTTCISLVGLIVLMTSPTGGGKLAGYYLTWAVIAGHALSVTIIASCVSGYTKKVTYNGGSVVFATLGNFFGPLIMMSSFQIGLIVFVVINVLIMLLLLIVRFQMARDNNKRQNDRLDEKTDPNLDYTDREDVNFVYRL